MKAVDQLKATVDDWAAWAVATDTAQDAERVNTWLDEDVLDMQVSMRMSLFTHEPRAMMDRKVHALLSMGGPNVWLIANDSGGVEVVGHWGTDQSRRFVPAEWLAGWMQDYADSYLPE